MKEKELNREERNKTVMETGALVMAEFYADWCPHCQKMMPIVKEFILLRKGEALWRQSGEMNLDRLRKVVEDVVG